MARWDERRVELLTDACAARTLWYALTADAFLASTSQRALVALLGSFELEPEAVSWMLSAGTLGPEVAWDARLARVPPDARLTLDRAAWRLDLRATGLQYEPRGGGRRAHLAVVRAALAAACAVLELDLWRWPLALSGGVDSRALLAVLVKQGRRPCCITWTTRAALRSPLSDAALARIVAAHAGVEHEIVVVEPAAGEADDVLDRFVAASAGRTDEIAGYVDGLRLWSDLFRAGVRGVLRGDEAYGTYAMHPSTYENSRIGIGGAMVTDYPDGHLIHSLGLAAQRWPERLRPRAGEDRLRYRVRLIAQSWNANQGASLSSIKARYVELAEPHLARGVLDVARTLRADLLTGKRAITAISREVAPLVPTARTPSTPSVAAFLSRPDMLELLVRELLDPSVERVLPGDGPRRVLAALVAPGETGVDLGARVKRVVKAATVPLPKPLVARLKPPWKGPDPLSARRLAFRVALASRAVRLLEADASALDGAPEA